ncbi:peptidoglycan-binding protein [Streptomyces sp. B93]|uniref:peptidoglycan-binding protein n=1 Tax=Streptomyces sp. B93 TaxID=2824875 RepID=UPI001B37609D|nr:peptidoglycan-binding protein [Streptomyces sp. B93]MBQ1090552.1 peptidoglycan-binding protein [Streptomyces sp. B93]
MSRWKELPGGLHPQVTQLIVELRKLKDRGELSTRQLATKTGYSARSWVRYLNGRSLPPREAVQALARLGGQDPARLLVLHEIAAAQWARGRTPATPRAAPPPPGDQPTPPKPYGRWLRIAVVAQTLALVVSVSVALVLAVQLAKARSAAEGDSVDMVVGTSPDPASVLPALYTCRPERSDGRWYAGHSRTQDAIVAYGDIGPTVIEAQCLLRRADVSPGDVDGIFGPLTQRAVKRFQLRYDLTADGVIGPLTWRALRQAAPQ